MGRMWGEWGEVEMKRRNKEMFSCLGIERLAPWDMMDELWVYRDKSWTDGSDAHQSQRSVICLHNEPRGTSSGEEVNYTQTNHWEFESRNNIEYPAEMELACLPLTIINHCLYYYYVIDFIQTRTWASQVKICVTSPQPALNVWQSDKTTWKCWDTYQTHQIFAC